MSNYPGATDPYNPGGQQPYPGQPDPYNGDAYGGAGQAPYGGAQQPYPGQPDVYGAPGQAAYAAGQQAYPGQPGYGNPYQGMQPPNPTEKNWMGVTALVLGCLTICCSIFTGIPAIVFGILGLMAHGKGEADNKAMSIAGIALGAGFIVLGVLLNLTGALNELMQQ